MISIEHIQHEVAFHFGLRIEQLRGPQTSRSVARPRQIAMYLARSLTDHSYPEIGAAFGKRDHSTAIHAVQVVERLWANDPGIAAHVDTLVAELEAA